MTPDLNQLFIEPGHSFEEDVSESAGQQPRRCDDDRVERLVPDVGPLLPEPRMHAMMGELTQHTGLGDRVVRTQAQVRPQRAFRDVHPVRRQQQ